ncbi:MAG: hypothetical protein IAG13_13430 [Deltaproteobacteria bacterium]|nr:hypothetical protein [Nannocystaceae bacterium]
MSYEDAISLARSTVVPPPSLTDLRAAVRWDAVQRPAEAEQRAAARRIFGASLAFALLAGVGLARGKLRVLLTAWFFGDAARAMTGSNRTVDLGFVLASLLPVVLLVWAARLVRKSQFGPQMLARGIVWSSLVVGVLISCFEGLIYAVPGAIVATFCAMALIRLRGRGLEPGPGDGLFRPVAFRTHLVLALVMACADAQTLCFAAVLQIASALDQSVAPWSGLLTSVCAIVMIAAVWGVYRLRVWGLMLNVLGNVAIAWLALDGVLRLEFPIGATLAITATIQLLLTVPLIATVLGDRDAGRPVFAGRLRNLWIWLLVVMVAVSWGRACDPTGERPGWLIGQASQTRLRGLPPIPARTP